MEYKIDIKSFQPMAYKKYIRGRNEKSRCVRPRSTFLLGGKNVYFRV